MQPASSHNRCDVHIIVNSEYEQYHEQCFSSLEEEPINIFKIPATKGHVGIGRWKGFNSGSAEFVSFVDDDDYIIPGIFQKCFDALDANPDAIGVVSQEYRLKDGELHGPAHIELNQRWVDIAKAIHHITVYRRDRILPYVEKIKDCNTGEMVLLLLEVLSDGNQFCKVDEPGYVWRVHGEGAHETIRPMTSSCHERGNEIIRKARADEKALHKNL